MDLEFQIDGVEITILRGPYIEDDRPTPKAVNDYTQLIQMLDAFKEFAADKLLKLYNENWRNEENEQLDLAAFAARLTNPSIQLADEIGAITVYFEDDDLFAGHYIEVLIQDGKPTHAGLIG